MAWSLMKPARGIVLAILACVVAAGLSTAGNADATTALPLLETTTVDTTGYVAWRVSVPANHTFRYEVEDSSPTSRVTTAAIWLGAANATPEATYYEQTSRWQPHTEYVAGADPALPRLAGSVDQDELSGEGENGESSVTLQPRIAKEYLIVFLLAGEDDWSLTLRLYGSPGVTLVAATNGPAHFLQAHEFPAQRVLYAEGAYGLAKVAVVDSARFDMHVGSRLFGWFDYAESGSNAELSYTEPSGQEVGGRTSYAFSGLEPGPYSFRVERMSDGCLSCPAPRVWLLAADVTIPA